MINDAFENYQYNSCVSRGVCSLSPKNSALQTVLVLYLRLFSVYAIKLEIELDSKLFVLNVLASAFYNPDFNEETFLLTVKKFREELFKISAEYRRKFPDINLEQEEKKCEELFNNTDEIVLAIKFGEQIFKRALENIPSEIRDVYSILLIIAKTLSLNILDLYSYGKFENEAFNTVIKILSLINYNERNLDILKSETIEAANINIQILREIHRAQEERYGFQEKTEVSYSTYPNKAVLVVGSNIRELEEILEKLENEDIDVYTHDDMMLAYTFPKFKSFKNLSGQFGLGLENCLLDFATFPGPIILTKHSLHNVESFYRGLLFTTDYISPKGIIKIVNNDYSELIKSAYQSKGFKRGKQCENVEIGYVYDEIISTIKNKIFSAKINHIFFIGIDVYSLEQRIYFEKIIKLASKDTLIISFSHNLERENLVYVNTCFDYYGLLKIFEGLRDVDVSKTIFVPKCGRNSISEMIYFASQKNVNVYVGKCTPIVVNPTLINTLEKYFQIFSTTTSKKDLELIYKDK